FESLSLRQYLTSIVSITYWRILFYRERILLPLEKLVVNARSTPRVPCTFDAGTLACAARGGARRNAPRPRAVSGDHVRRPAAFSGTVESPDTIATFFRSRPTAGLIGAARHFGAALPLGIFTASAVSRLQVLGVR